MCKDRELLYPLDSCTIGKNCSKIVEGNVSHPPEAKSNEDSQEIMDVWSDLGGKVIRHDKGNDRCFML